MDLLLVRPHKVSYKVSRSTTTAVCNNCNSAGPTCSDRDGTAKFRCQLTDYLEQSAACTTVTRFVTECLQKSTGDISVLNRPAPLRLFRDGAGYKYSDLLTYIKIS